MIKSFAISDGSEYRHAPARTGNRVAHAVRNVLRSYGPLVALSGVAVTLTAMPAHAATANGNAADSDDLQEIVVTGLRKSLQSAQQIKQNAEEIVDSVTSQDIGAMPDRSVAEALQRIPGITIERSDSNRDPARLSAEGGNVFVRGLPWVRSELNGRDVFSATDGRAITWEDLSADLLAGVDVHKNPAADQIEGGIAGSINMRMRLPFDSNKQLVAATFDYNHADLAAKGFTSGSALYSNQWETGIGKLGALLSVSIGNAGNRTDAIQAGAYQPETDNGQTVWLPNAIGWRSINWEQKRQAVDAALQWAPSDKLTLTLQTVLTKATPKNWEHTLGDDNDLGEVTTPQSGNVYALNDGQNVVQNATVANSLLTTDTRYEEDHKSTYDYSFDAKYKPDSNWTLSTDLQYVASHADMVSMTAFSQLANPTGYNGQLSYNFGGDTPSVMFSEPSNVSPTASQSSYWWAAAMDHLEDNDAHSFAERFDVEYAFDDNPWLQSIRVGVRGTEKQATTRETGWNWGFLSNAFWDGGAGNTSAAYLNNTALAPASASELYTYPDFMHGSVAVPGVAWFPSLNVVNQGTAHAYNILKNTETGGWGWAPLSTDYTLAAPKSDNANGGINEQTEHTLAAYALIRFQHATPLGQLDGNIGARIVKTSMETGAGSVFNSPLSGGDAAACAAVAATATPPIDCTQYDASYLFSLGGNAVLPAASQTYTDVLPTLNVRLKLTDELQWRVAMGRAISRPSFSQMQNYVNLGYSFTNFSPSGGEDGDTGSAGNPYLKPTTADQIDSSLEWYFAPTGSLAADVFYKDISNYVFSQPVVRLFTSNGVTLPFEYSENVNGSHGTVKGVEFQYQQFFDMLPSALSGLGVQFNYTYVDAKGGKNSAINVNDAPELTGAGSATLPLEGISPHSFNAALLYEKYGISARVAYNWRDKYLLTTSAANINLPVWSEAYGQLDASVFYTIVPQVKVGLQAENLTNTRTFLDVSLNQGNLALVTPRYSWSNTDRRLAAVLRVSF